MVAYTFLILSQDKPVEQPKSESEDEPGEESSEEEEQQKKQKKKKPIKECRAESMRIMKKIMGYATRPPDDLAELRDDMEIWVIETVR